MEVEFKHKQTNKQKTLPPKIQEQKKRTFLEGLLCAWEGALLHILSFYISNNAIFCVFNMCQALFPVVLYTEGYLILTMP